MQIRLKSPLNTTWTVQYIKLDLAGVRPGTSLSLTINGKPTAFQYTGTESPAGAEIMLKLGFAQDETKILVFEGKSLSSSQDSDETLERLELPLNPDTRIGIPGNELTIGPETPFCGFAGRNMTSKVHCETAFEEAKLTRTNNGPLFIDYELTYRYAENRHYILNFRCYKLDQYIEVCESFSLGMNAELTWTLNPEKILTHIISRDSFERESQPSTEPLGKEHPRDVLCRLQIPVLSEYFIPNNHDWIPDGPDVSRCGSVASVPRREYDGQ